MVKHTPGPWTARKGNLDFIIDAPTATCIGTAIDEADARMFAAAPQMLEALKLALPQMIRDNEDPEGINWWEHIDRFNAAIRNAEETE